MTEPAKCPICGMDVEWDEQFGWECIDDGFSGPRMAMESVSPTNIATLAWNTLCEQIRVGKAILAVKPDDHEFLGEHPYFEVGGMVYWKTQPIPEPPAQELTDEELKTVVTIIGKIFTHRSQIERYLEIGND